jgi:hypothetical protein
MPTSDITADNLMRAVANGVVPFVSHPADKVSAAMEALTYPVLGRGAPGETVGDRLRKNVATEGSRTQAFETDHPSASMLAGLAGNALTLEREQPARSAKSLRTRFLLSIR